MEQTQYRDLDVFLSTIESLRGNYFSFDKKIHINRCPGRLDLMGGNDDYTGGLVFETTIQETTIFGAQEREDTDFYLKNPSVEQWGWTETIHFSLQDIMQSGNLRDITEIRHFINSDERKSWFTYIIGGLCYLVKEYPEKVRHGLNMYLDSTIPLGKGVSSSAALETSALKACAAAYGVEINGIRLALATQWVECEISGAAAGIMDQYAVVKGQENYFTPMICQPCIELPVVKLPAGIKIWGIDSGVRHSVGGTAYEAARAACFMGYQLITEIEKLQVHSENQGPLVRFTDPKFEGYLARITPTEFRSKYEPLLPEKMKGKEFLRTHSIHFDPYTRILDDISYAIRKATRYAVEENNRATLFYQIMSLMPDNPDDLGLAILAELMHGAHLGYTDCGLGCAETDQLVGMVKNERQNDLFGAKITGGGAGGTVAILGRDSLRAQEAVERVFDTYREETGNQPWLFEGSTQGADAFGIYTLD